MNKNFIFKNCNIYIVITYISILLLIVYIILIKGFSINDLQLSIKNYGYFAPVVYIILFAITPVLFLPITPMLLTAGFLFGPFWGTVYAIIGANIAASNSFLLSRYLAKDYIKNIKSNKLKIIQSKIEKLFEKR